MAWNDERPDLMALLNQAETHYGIPPDLLARIAYQECSWRNEVIDCTVKSPAGAVGMFQLIPDYFPGAGLDWRKDAATAAQYLVSLFRRFQTWQNAVAAYNWGPGNFHRYLTLPGITMPEETSNYLADVFNDVSVTSPPSAVVNV